MNLLNYLNEEVDQNDIGLYVSERNSDLTKCDVINNLWKPDIDYKFPVYIDKNNPTAMVYFISISVLFKII